MDAEKQRQCRRNDARLTECGNARSELLLVMPTELLTNREWLPGSERPRPGWFLDIKYPTCPSVLRQWLVPCFYLLYNGAKEWFAFLQFLSGTATYKYHFRMVVPSGASNTGHWYPHEPTLSPITTLILAMDFLTWKIVTCMQSYWKYILGAEIQHVATTTWEHSLSWY